MKRVLFAILVLCVAAPVNAGKLKDVESAIGSSDSSSSSSSSSSSYSSSSSSDSSFWLMDLAFGLIGIGQATSASSSQSLIQSPIPESANVRPTSYSGVNQYLRSEHSFSLPVLRFDGSYQYVAGGVDAMHFRGEAGYLIFGADVDYTRYYERGTSDHLNNFATHGLLRLPLAAEYFELDIALGYRRIWGDQKHQAFDYGFPMYLNPTHYLQFDFKPYFSRINTRPIVDMDMGVAYKYKLAGVRAGYRYYNANGATLKGPEVGLFFQW